MIESYDAGGGAHHPDRGASLRQVGDARSRPRLAAGRPVHALDATALLRHGRDHAVVAEREEAPVLRRHEDPLVGRKDAVPGAELEAKAVAELIDALEAAQRLGLRLDRR